MSTIFTESLLSNNRVNFRVLRHCLSYDERMIYETFFPSHFAEENFPSLIYTRKEFLFRPILPSNFGWLDCIALFSLWQNEKNVF